MNEPTRRVFLARMSAAASATMALPALARSPGPAQAFVPLTDFGVTGRNDGDMSKEIQAAIDEASGNGGGIVVCPPGQIWAKALVVPNNITIQGAGVGATTIKLPDGANADLIQQSGYAQNKTFANLYFALRDLTIDGNKTKNERGNLVVLRGYRGLVERVRFARAAGHGVLYSEPSADGTLNLNGLAENTIRGCIFDECNGAGLYARTGSGQRIADMFIVDNVFNGNGGAGNYQIDLERAAGFHIKGNQMYRGYLGDIRAKGAGALIVALNHLDGTDNNPVDGVLRQVVIETGGWGNVIVANNLFHAHRPADPSITSWHQLDVAAHSSAGTGVAITGNSFYATFAKGASAIVRRGPGADKIVASANAVGGTSLDVGPAATKAR